MTAKASRATEYSTPNDTDIVSRRVFDAPVEVMWEMWTNPKHIPRWLTGPDGWTMPVCEVDLRPGGRWHFTWRKTVGTEMSMDGEYREVVAPRRLVQTERWGPEWPETLNTLELEAVDGGTLCTLTISYPSTEAREAALATGMKGGSERSFERLDEYLATL